MAPLIVALAPSSLCVGPAGCSGLCSDLDGVEEEYADDLRANIGVPRTYTATGREGTVRLDMTLNGFDSRSGDHTTSSRWMRAADTLTDVFVSRAHASECPPISFGVDAAFEITWTPDDGTLEMLASTESGHGSYEHAYADTSRLFIYHEGISLQLDSTDGFNGLEIVSFEHPEHHDIELGR